MGPGKKYFQAPVASATIHCVWHLAVAAVAALSPDCRDQAGVPLGRGSGTAPWTPASPPPPQGGDVPGLPACLLGRMQLRGKKGGGMSERAEPAACLPASSLVRPPVRPWAASGSTQPRTSVGEVQALMKGEKGDSAAWRIPLQDPPIPRRPCPFPSWQGAKHSL